MEQIQELIQETHCQVKSEQEKYDLLAKAMAEYEFQAANLIQILHFAQAIFGCLSDDVQEFIADKMNLSRSTVSGVVSFYSYFTTQPKGKYIIQVCLGTACYVRGGKKVLDALKEELQIDVGETTDDRKFSLEVKRCIGSCALAPAVAVNDVVHKRVNPGKIRELLQQYE